MNLLQLIRRESGASLWKIAAMAGLSGGMNALLLAIINMASGDPADEAGSFRYMVMFACAIGIFVIAQFYLLSKSSALVESCLNNVRLRLLDKILGADLLPFEGMGRPKLYYVFANETLAISQATTTIVIAGQAGLMVGCSIIYLAIISRPAFFLTLLFTGAGTLLHLQMSQRMQGDMAESVRKEHAFLDLLQQLLAGFKEVKLDGKRAVGLRESLRATSESLMDLKIKSTNHFNKHYIFSQSSFYILIGALVFLLPRFSEAYSEVLRQITATILFITGPLTGFIGAIPIVAAANVAVANIDRVERELGGAQEKLPLEVLPATTHQFQQIRMRDVVFWYGEPGKAGFKLGPMNLTIEQGEVLFIVGGNGSGKSTFLKLLTYLYYPKEGSIFRDGIAIDETNYPEFRNLFSVIFSDYHLFDRLYGSPQYSLEKVNELLAEFQLAEKTKLIGDHWQTTDLSTGQRKRLALITCCLDRKPIYVLDEWAADQDPLFRRYFYETILPDLKRQGATVIAATHDDHYFHLADRILKLDFGQIVPYENDTNRGQRS
jgi:putative ATP-binding cassette transporter